MTLYDLLAQYTTVEDMPRFAKKQGVESLLYDEIEKGGENPFGMMGLMRLSGMAQKQEKMWDVQKEAINMMSHFCRKHNLNVFIFKGYALSLLYDNPARRKSGDVDVFFFEERVGDEPMKCAASTIDKMLIANGDDVEIGEKHSAFEINDEHIESHYHFVASDEFPHLQIVEDYLMSLPMKKSEEWERVYYPSPNFDAVFLPLHMGCHFVYEGTNLKQLVDWATFLKKCGKEVDWTEVYSLVDKAGYRAFLDVLNALSISLFDVDEDMVGGHEFVVRNTKLEQKVLDEIINSIPYDRETRSTDVIKYLSDRTLQTYKDRWKLKMVFDENALSWFFRHAVGFVKERMK